MPTLTGHVMSWSFFISKKKLALSNYHLLNDICEHALTEICEHILNTPGYFRGKMETGHPPPPGRASTGLQFRVCNKK